MRISAINLNKNKRLVIALTYVKGIGLSTSRKILRFLNIDESLRVKDAEEFSQSIQKYINDNAIKTEDEVTKETSDNIKKLILIQNRRGKRHVVGLPIKARTRSNAKTARRLMRKI
jgi:small subunit ribosomal protein S13